MKLLADRISVNGRASMKVWAVDDDGERLPYGDKVTDLGSRSVRAKMAKAMVEDLGCTEDAAKAAIQQLYLMVERQVADAEGAPPAIPPKTAISARLAGLVDIVRSDDDGRPVYLFVEESGLITADYHDEDGIRYVPPELKHLPYELPREGKVLAAYFDDTDSSLYADLLDWHKRASQLRDIHYHLLILFDFHTYRADDADYSPMVTFSSSEPERGKSRAGKAVAFVSYRGLVTETLQEANLFRWSDSLGCTLFIDVRDVWSKAQKRGSDDILLGRFDRHGPLVSRVLDPQAGPFEGVRYFSVYGPTIIAVNEGLREPFTSRCVLIVPPEVSGKYPNIYPKDGLPFRERLVAWRARTMGTPLPTIPKPVAGRLGDILQPLGQIAHLLGADVVAEYETLAEFLAAERRSERSESSQARLVAAVVNAISEPQVADRFSVAAVARHWNQGLPEDKQSANSTIGNRLSGLGFQRAGRLGQEQARWRDDSLLSGLCRKYGVPEVVDIADSPDTSDRDGLNQAQKARQMELSGEMSNNPTDKHGYNPVDIVDSDFRHKNSEVSGVSDQSRPISDTLSDSSFCVVCGRPVTHGYPMAGGGVRHNGCEG